MTPLHASALAVLCAGPVALWLAGQIMFAPPGSPAAPYGYQAAHALGLAQAMVLATAIPLLAERRALPSQLMATTLAAAAPWPLYALAVLADALSWGIGVAFGTILIGLAGLMTAAMVLGLRRLAKEAWELPLRFAAAAGSGLVVWVGWHHGLHRLTGQ